MRSSHHGPSGDRSSAAALRPAGGCHRARRRRRFAPNLLALEARALLSTLTVTNDNDSGTGSLRYELGAASAGDTIKFSPKAYGTITLTSGPLQVATNVDIKGPGSNKVTVSGDDKSTVFDVQSGVTATISGLTITDGLYSQPYGFGGGGIANYGTLSVSDCVITGNSVPFPGYVIGGGGIFTLGTLSVTGSTITGNSAYIGGGIQSFRGDVTVEDSTIADNSGGGIQSFGGDVTLTDSTVSGSTGSGVAIQGYAYDGPIPTLTVTGSTIKDNSGTQFGGGILSSTANVTVSGSVIADNTASYPGGGLSLGGGIDMEGSLFSPTPGADSLTITGTTFVGNQAGSGGAIHTKPYVDLSVCDSSFLDNTASGVGLSDGGAMDLQSLSQGTISDCQFTGNQAIGVSLRGPAYGGAIDYDGEFGVTGSLTIRGSTFTNDLAQGGAGGGGAYGGAIYNNGQRTALFIMTCALLDNSALGGVGTATAPYGGFANGGALSTFFTSATVTNSTFIGNSAKGGADAFAGGSAGLGSGGAIVNVLSPLTMTGDILAGNSAKGGAGSNRATGGNAWGGGLVNFRRHAHFQRRDDPGQPGNRRRGRRQWRGRRRVHLRLGGQRRVHRRADLAQFGDRRLGRRQGIRRRTLHRHRRPHHAHEDQGRRQLRLHIRRRRLRDLHQRLTLRGKRGGDLRLRRGCWHSDCSPMTPGQGPRTVADARSRVASSGASRMPGSAPASASRPARLPGYAPTLLAYHRAFERELRGLIAGLPLRPGDRVLDLACGDGVYARWLAERLGQGGRVLAVNLSPAFLELARREVAAGELSDRVTFARADLRHLPIPDDSVDLVWCAQSLYSLPDPVDALRRMARAARPGGTVAVLENDEFHHVLLPWPVEVELALRQAELTALKQLSKQPHKFYVGRHLRPAFRAAGLADCRHRTWTIDRQAPLGPDDRAYFAGYLADLREKASPHLSGEVSDEFERLVEPSSPAYLLDNPDFTATCLNHFAWSVKPGG